MKTFLSAVLLGMLGTMVPLSAESVLDETIPTPGGFTAIPTPGGFSASPSAEDAQQWWLYWTPVEGASYYRIWREVMVDHGLNQDGTVVALSQPKSAWIPWARVDAVSGMDAVRALVSALDLIQTRWGITAEVDKGGVIYHSPMAISSESVTAVEALGWGGVKARAGQ